jgi:DNA-binding Xre family transcriptional regulator
MIEEEHKRKQRRREVQVIKKIIGPDQGGRGAYLPGLWACRMAAGLTQRELSERAGTGPVTIRQLERQDRRARATTLRRLSAALNVEPVDLLTGEAAEE